MGFRVIKTAAATLMSVLLASASRHTQCTKCRAFSHFGCGGYLEKEFPDDNGAFLASLVGLFLGVFYFGY